MGTIYVQIISSGLFHSLIHIEPLSLSSGSNVLMKSGGYFSALYVYPLFNSVGLHTKGWKCMSGSMTFAGYVIGAHRAAPHDPILTADKAAISPFEQASKSA